MQIVYSNSYAHAFSIPAVPQIAPLFQSDWRTQAHGATSVAAIGDTIGGTPKWDFGNSGGQIPTGTRIENTVGAPFSKCLYVDDDGPPSPGGQVTACILSALPALGEIGI